MEISKQGFLALSSEPVDSFNQACIYTFLVGIEELIRFWWPIYMYIIGRNQRVN